MGREKDWVEQERQQDQKGTTQFGRGGGGTVSSAKVEDAE